MCLFGVLIGCRISRQRWLAVYILFSFSDPTPITDALLWAHHFNLCDKSMCKLQWWRSEKRVRALELTRPLFLRQINFCIQRRVSPGSDFSLTLWLARGPRHRPHTLSFCERTHGRHATTQSFAESLINSFCRVGMDLEMGFKTFSTPWKACDPYTCKHTFNAGQADVLRLSVLWNYLFPLK